MSLLADIQARIAARVPALAGRIGGAGDVSRLIQNKGLPQHGTSVMVVPNGLRSGGDPEAISGLFRQPVQEVLAVLVAYRAAMREGDAATDLSETVRAVIEALVGWQVPGRIGVVSLLQARALGGGADNGTLLYQIDLLFPDQLRVNPT